MQVLRDATSLLRHLIMPRFSLPVAFASCVVGCMLTVASPASGQAFFELGAGWSYLAAPVAQQVGTYSHAVSGRVSIGRKVTPSLRARFDAVGVQFDQNVQYFPPCPAPGCTRSYYRRQSNSIVGMIGNGVLDVDPHGILYLIGGTGVYAASVPSAEWHLGVSGGAGIAVPVRTDLHVFVEAAGHHLFGRTAGPSHFVPITIGLRY
jgi:hypothetical protein